MVAYNFKARFAPPIIAGTKTQTIRANGRRRHARPGEELQLYTGMRTRGCRLLARPLCTAALPVEIALDVLVLRVTVDGLPVYDLNTFARRDGFEDSADFQAFWEETHGLSEDTPFLGTLIAWAGDAVRPEAPE